MSNERYVVMSARDVPPGAVAEGVCTDSMGRYHAESLRDRIARGDRQLMNDFHMRNLPWKFAVVDVVATAAKATKPAPKPTDRYVLMWARDVPAGARGEGFYANGSDFNAKRRGVIANELTKLNSGSRELIIDFRQSMGWLVAIIDRRSVDPKTELKILDLTDATWNATAVAVPAAPPPPTDESICAAWEAAHVVRERGTPPHHIGEHVIQNDRITHLRVADTWTSVDDHNKARQRLIHARLAASAAAAAQTERQRHPGQGDLPCELDGHDAPVKDPATGGASIDDWIHAVVWGSR